MFLSVTRLMSTSALGHKQTFREVQTMSALPPKADIADLLGKRPFLASSPQIAATRLFRPSCFAYKLAHALTPPDSFINVRSPLSRAFERATYRNALDHLLTILMSTVLPHVHRITAVKGSVFLSNLRLANANACRSSRLVRRRTL